MQEGGYSSQWDPSRRRTSPTSLILHSMYMPPFLPHLLRIAFPNLSKVSKLSTAPFSATATVMAQEYKIKGLSSLDLKSGEKREVEVEGIENGKVLLAKVGDKTHAMSANCTHYGAPLKLGVLTPDGRLTCAWHGGSPWNPLCLLCQYQD